MPKSEHQEQVDFFFKARKYFRETNNHYMRNLLFAVPNGGLRDKVTASKLKMEGVLAGVPDIFFAHPSPSAYGLFIEMKKTVGGSTSAVQKKILNALREEGYVCVVARGSEEAYKNLLDYIHDRI